MLSIQRYVLINALITSSTHYPLPAAGGEDPGSVQQAGGADRPPDLRPARLPAAPRRHGGGDQPAGPGRPADSRHPGTVAAP